MNLVADRYELLDALGSGGTGEVFRAEDRLTQQSVALKRLQRRGSYYGADESDRIALAREFRVLSALRHPHIVSVLDFGFDRGEPFYTMSLLQGAVTILEGARERDREAQIELVFQLLEALSYLHRRGIVHGDVKPSNVMVHDGAVVVLDFGVAGRGSGDAARGGTVSYSAPEVLMGEAPTPASDLYGAGVVIYEMLAERHPFEHGFVRGMLYRVLREVPDLTPLPGDRRLASLVAHMLSKDPGQRVSDAAALLRSLANVTSRPLPPESTALRESCVRSPAFVGRDRELASLEHALTAALDGFGSLWLIAGESGAGKSRLMAELCAQALTRGALVLRGRALAAGATPFQLFRDPVRRLCLSTAVEARELRILKAFYPEVEHLLGRSVEALQLDPESMAGHLAATVEALFQRCPYPTVLELSDVHLAREGLFLLRRLNQVVRALPLLVIVEFRTDERPDLPDAFPDASLLHLGGLTRDQIRALAESVLGELGSEDAVVDLLERETGGNVFFVTEAIRALADEAGRLDDVDPSVLPERLVISDATGAFRKRLTYLSPDNRAALKLAAAMGRDFDLHIVEAAQPALNLTEWLAASSEALVVEGSGSRWRFVHDRVREAVLADTSANERAELHAMVGKSIEDVHGAVDEWIPALAFHWKEACRLADGHGKAPEATSRRKRATRYLLLAANQILAAGLPEEAVDLSIEAATLTGAELSREPQFLALAIGGEIAKIHRLLEGRRPSDLLSLPDLDDEMVENALEALALIEPAAYISYQLELFALVALKSMSLTLEHGVGRRAPHVFAAYATVARAVSGDARLADEFSQLGMDLDRRRRGAVSSSVGFLHAWFTNHWLRPVVTNLPLAADASRVGFEDEPPDALYGCFNAAAYVIYLAASGAPLQEVEATAEAESRRIGGRVRVAAFHCLLERQVARALSGLTTSPTTLSDESCDEERELASIRENMNQNQTAYYLTAKLRLHYLQREYGRALRYADQAAALLPAFQGQVAEWEFVFLHALALAARAGQAEGELRDSHLAAARVRADRLRTWGQLCEANFAHKALLVNAEIARVKGDEETALDAFRLAAESAAEHGFLQYEALAHERAALFHREAGAESRWHRERTAAVEAYRRWGAEMKAKQLEAAA